MPWQILTHLQRNYGNSSMVLCHGSEELGRSAGFSAVTYCLVVYTPGFIWLWEALLDVFFLAVEVLNVIMLNIFRVLPRLYLCRCRTI